MRNEAKEMAEFVENHCQKLLLLFHLPFQIFIFHAFCLHFLYGITISISQTTWIQSSPINAIANVREFYGKTKEDIEIIIIITTVWKNTYTHKQTAMNRKIHMTRRQNTVNDYVLRRTMWHKNRDNIQLNTVVLSDDWHWRHPRA